MDDQYADIGGTLIKNRAYSDHSQKLHEEAKYRSMVGAMTKDSREKLYGIQPTKSVVDRVSLATSAKHFFLDPQWRELSMELQNIDFKAKGTPLFLSSDQIVACLEAGVCVDRGDGKVVFTNQFTKDGMQAMTAFDFCNDDSVNITQVAHTLTVEQGDVFEETVTGHFLNVSKYPLVINRFSVDKTKKYRELTKYVPDVPMD